EDVRGVAEVRVGLVPRDPGGGATGAGEVDRRRLGLHRGVDVEGRRGALRDPGAVREGTDEDLLRAAEPLLEGRPRDLDFARDDRATGHVDEAGVLVRIDRVQRVVVHLGAVRRERYEGRRGGGSENQCPHKYRHETKGVECAGHSKPPFPPAWPRATPDGLVLPLYAQVGTVDDGGPGVGR